MDVPAVVGALMVWQNMVLDASFLAWANPLQAGHLLMLAESTSGILFPQMATVLPFVSLASVNDGKWWRRGRETNVFIAISF